MRSVRRALRELERTELASKGEPPINLVPMIDILTVLVLYLLISTIFRHFTILQLNLPGPAQAVPAEERPPLDLKVVLRAQRLEVHDRNGTVRLLDARGAPRYRGETEPVDAYPGHIPTAISAPTDGNLSDDGRFLSASELAERYRALGADGSTVEVVVSCGSGVSATHDALALRIAGLPDARLYPGSYSDWTRSGLPVVTGDDPGEMPE